MRDRSKLIVLCATILTLAVVGPATRAQQAGSVPDDLEGVGITQNLDAQLPLEAKFTDENGRSVALQDYFRGDRPVLLTLVYYRCPMLCTLVLDGLVDALQEIDWVPGQEFEIVTVSIDPLETRELAYVKKRNYISSYGRAGAAAGWHFLTGQPGAIEELADTVGFRYKYLPERREYSHPAAVIVITPEGRVSRYLLGINHDPRTVRLSLVEASQGKIGSVVDQFLLYCYSYDSAAGQYTPVAWRLMRLAGVATALVLGATLLTYWLREARQRRIA
jgi:protein SCO1/2